MPLSVESPVVLPPAHTPPSESSIELDPPVSSIASRHDDEVTVAAAISADKTRLRQQSAMYDKILDKVGVFGGQLGSRMASEIVRGEGGKDKLPPNTLP